MHCRYPSLLSPLKVGSYVLKNRISLPRSIGGAFQGPETWPTEATITHMANAAKNGAAIVTCQGGDWLNEFVPDNSLESLDRKYNEPDYGYGIGSFLGPGQGRIAMEDRGTKLYFQHMVDEIHLYGSLAAVWMVGIEPIGYVFSERRPGYTGPIGGHMMISPTQVDMGNQSVIRDMGHMIRTEGQDPLAVTTQMLDRLVLSYAEKAWAYRRMGFDMVTFYVCQDNSLMAQSISPVLNYRQDKYGGQTLQERAAFTIAIFREVRKHCPGMLIEIQISGEEDIAGGYTVGDMVEYIRLLEQENLVDIVQPRAKNNDLVHPTGYNSRKDCPEALHYAEALKSGGIGLVISPVGGFHDPELNDRWIREGKADLISVARPFITDFSYGEKIYAGRGEDIVPCLRCSLCHGQGTVVCPVNPEMGLEHKIDRLGTHTGNRFHCAVIGGGPAGMRLALELSRLGHQADLYEKSDCLGGLLKHTYLADFKWPVREYLEWMIRQINKDRNITVYLNTEATKDSIAAQNYDVVVAAVGSEPKLPELPIAPEADVWLVPDAYFHEKQLGHRVVVVGGSENGTEISLFLARHGHQVTNLTRQEKPAHDAFPADYYGSLLTALEEEPNYQYILRAATTEVQPGKVIYEKDGIRQVLLCDSIVVLGGMVPKTESAMEFYNSGSRFFMIGDCKRVGKIATCTRDAYGVAITL